MAQYNLHSSISHSLFSQDRPDIVNKQINKSEISVRIERERVREREKKKQYKNYVMSKKKCDLEEKENKRNSNLIQLK